MSRSKRILPPDSRPIADADLNQADMDYLVDLQDILSAMRAELPKTAEAARAAAGWSPEGRLFARIDPTRTPRVVLISGPRGTGKTALMLTLLHRWERVANRVPGLNNPKMENGDGVWDDGLAAACRALPILDFDPMPPGMPLVAWLIRAFEPLVRHLNRSAESSLSRGGRSAGSDSIEEGNTLEDRWERLHENALIAWSTEKESGQELARGKVRAWNQLRETWTDFVDTLLVAMRKGRNPLLTQDGLLVLPIDDVDMQVARVPEIVRDLRNLHHPAVVFMVTGHRPLLVEALQLDVDGQRRRLTREMPRADWAAKIDSETDQMGERLVQKVFPDGLTVKTDPFTLSQALSWRQERLLVWLTEATQRVQWKAIAEWPEVSDNITLSRRDLINLYSRLEAAPAELNTDQSLYLVFEILQSTHKEIRPIYGDIVRLTSANPTIWRSVDNSTSWSSFDRLPSLVDHQKAEDDRPRIDLNGLEIAAALLVHYTTKYANSDPGPSFRGLVATNTPHESLKFYWPNPLKPSTMRELLDDFNEFRSIPEPERTFNKSSAATILPLVEKWAIFTSTKLRPLTTSLRAMPLRALVQQLRSEARRGNVDDKQLMAIEQSWLQLANPDFGLDNEALETLVDSLLTDWTHRGPTPEDSYLHLSKLSNPGLKKLSSEELEPLPKTVTGLKVLEGKKAGANRLWEILSRVISYGNGSWWTLHIVESNKLKPLNLIESTLPSSPENPSTVAPSESGTAFNDYLRVPSTMKWTSAAQQMGHYIVEGGRFSEFVQLTRQWELLNKAQKQVSSALWIGSMWDWLVRGSIAANWLKESAPRGLFVWNGPTLTIKAVFGPEIEGVSQFVGWHLTTQDTTAQHWMNEDRSRHLAAAGWLGLMASSELELFPDVDSPSSVRRHLFIGDTGLNGDLLGTDSPPPLSWAAIDRLWIELGRERLGTTAPPARRASKAVRALRVALSLSKGLGLIPPAPESLGISSTPFLSADLKTIFGHPDFSRTLPWARKAISGILERYRSELEPELIDVFETYTHTL